MPAVYLGLNSKVNFDMKSTILLGSINTGGICDALDHYGNGECINKHNDLHGHSKRRFERERGQ